MDKPQVQEIICAIKQSGMKLFTSPFSVNLGGIRTSDNRSNKFNDWLFAFCWDKDGHIILSIVPGTTDAGLYYRQHPMNIEGTAIIKHGVQHRGAYQLQDPDKNEGQRGHRGQKAFRQIKPMEYWRDNDRDGYLDFDGVTQIENAHTNGHYMGTLGNNVGKFSAGCWGSIVKHMESLYDVAQLQIDNGLGDKYSYTLLNENDML